MGRGGNSERFLLSGDRVNASSCCEAAEQQEKELAG